MTDRRPGRARGHRRTERGTGGRDGCHAAPAAGTPVALFLAAANTETEIFDDAPFDITAQRKPHLTFGGGIHYCLGAWLARIEMREALPILASRLGDIALTGPVPMRPRLGITGPVTLPLRFIRHYAKKRARGHDTRCIGA